MTRRGHRRTLQRQHSLRRINAARATPPEPPVAEAPEAEEAAT